MQTPADFGFRRFRKLEGLGNLCHILILKNKLFLHSKCGREESHITNIPYFHAIRKLIMMMRRMIENTTQALS